ncbi:sugar-transfer associated ATP-grasp domain-containing protein [Rhodoferax sp.]|uniref:sugar-transfer associated ATP-grasp domain-containing protein n=1 Tax=Rhodoferax sp. TaxID=50421 RepID=UPI00271F8639|nr:sugar-transfer associated ATP-grasp domain-containing protein [Rhodoferax sp.]MDO9195021.1 sugar-transfer associated ATP-grasp domain-containing protein [Rhodoferax sp.]
MSNSHTNPISRIAGQLNEYRDWASLAHQQTGKNLVTQVREIRALQSTGGQCGISDYYEYGLYNDSYLMGRGRQDFLGWRLQAKFSLALNPRYAVLPACDKTVFVQMASAAGLPVAPIRACFHRSARISDALGLHLTSREDAGAFVRDPSIYPMFGKPAFSQQGYGSAYLASYDPATDRLSLLDGQSIAVDEFLKRLDKSVDSRYHKPECGYLFQESLTLAPEIRAFTDWPAICGVRVICLNGPDGVQPIRAIWKVATPPNHVDNFSLGKNGNFLANVDLATGKVSRMVGGFWPKTEAFKTHPGSGHLVDGFQLPGWSQVMDACRRAGAVFPLMKIHHWDFALTDQGPMMLELNDVGGTEIAQVHGHGLLTVETRDFLKRHANTQTHPWVKAL